VKRFDLPRTVPQTGISTPTDGTLRACHPSEVGSSYDATFDAQLGAFPSSGIDRPNAGVISVNACLDSFEIAPSIVHSCRSAPAQGGKLTP
jgi:hypothetical protein